MRLRSVHGNDRFHRRGSGGVAESRADSSGSTEPDGRCGRASDHRGDKKRRPKSPWSTGPWDPRWITMHVSIADRAPLGIPSPAILALGESIGASGWKPLRLCGGI